MININLKTDGNSNKEKVDWGKALPLAAALLVVIGAAYLVVTFYTKKYEDGTKAAQNDYDQKLDNLKKGNAKDVFDFQNRLSESKKMLDGNLNPNNTLGEIEKVIIPSAYLTAYQFDAEKNSLDLTYSVSNYNDVAKQIASFKKTDYFSEVSLGDMKLSGQDGKISVSVNLKIK
jgi:hypothetical protein